MLLLPSPFFLVSFLPFFSFKPPTICPNFSYKVSPQWSFKLLLFHQFPCNPTSTQNLKKKSFLLRIILKLVPDIIQHSIANSLKALTGDQLEFHHFLINLPQACQLVLSLAQPEHGGIPRTTISRSLHTCRWDRPIPTVLGTLGFLGQLLLPRLALCLG